LLKRIFVAVLPLLLAFSFAMPLSSATPTFPPQGTVRWRSNIRNGPSTTNAIVGKAFSGQVVTIIGCNATCNWYQIADTQWIAAFLVNVADDDTSTPTFTPTPTTTPTVTPTFTPTPPDCDYANYTGACIPHGPPDLDCGEISARRFQSIGSDPHGFDGDNDGLACEGK